MKENRTTAVTASTDFDLEAALAHLHKRIQDMGFVNLPSSPLANMDDMMTTIDYLKTSTKASAADAKVAKLFVHLYYVEYLEKIDNETFNHKEFVHNYLGELQLDDSMRTSLYEAILKANITASDQGNLGLKIALDTIYAYYGEKKFKKKVRKLYVSKIAKDGVDYDEVLYLEDVLRSMKEHEYRTKPARKKWGKRKTLNIDKIFRYIIDLEQDAKLSSNKRAMTMFKTASRNQIDLVNIADKKAGIMITVNAILLTILIPLFSSYIFDMSSFIIPMAILTLTCGVSIVFAVLATMPISTEEPQKEDFYSGNKSPFYFRNFRYLDKPEFLETIKGVITKESIFEKSVFTDLYDVGISLSKKYRRLKICYLVFATGITVTVIALILSMLFIDF